MCFLPSAECDTRLLFNGPDQILVDLGMAGNRRFISPFGIIGFCVPATFLEREGGLAQLFYDVFPFHSFPLSWIEECTIFTYLSIMICVK